ncbi:Na+/H+ antiporter subunit A [Planctomonas psychrotolerans]|uniref:Na+/H+ antiporter subunit A n=1 Tax=Planctomonas psychrotolerans TaxID=2528712 RepID=UPI0012399FD8|nr:Na+/H+ antiporter subunit A [Planctomonas psychrotolerans]
MLAVLGAFLVVSLAIPVLSRRVRLPLFLIAALIPAAAFVHALTVAPRVLAGEEIIESVPWISALDITLTMRMDTLAWLLVLVVSGVGALVLLYCARYFAASEDGLGRFAAILLAFAGVMYGLVLSDDVFVLYVFWEATSVFSYLLIGHYTGKSASRGAALQALLVTTAGGLVMLIGIVILAQLAGTTSLAAIVEQPPAGPLATVGVMLLLIGALSKSALVPFHFWLPAAMAAPTPVSAYLHAAAMVKAGIYLVARLAPGFAEYPGWRVLLVSIGVVTMLVGGWRALKQFDLKLVLAYGTVSQLGFLTVVVGYGTRDAALAGVALLLAHALFKATLFLAVGIIDSRAGTRDLRKLSGLGRAAPVLAVVSALAVSSMVGLPPLLGFVAKEAVFTAFLTDALAGSATGWVALGGVALGSVLTVAYSARFLWGAFANKQGVEQTRPARKPADFATAPVILAVVSLAGGLLSDPLGTWLEGYADTLPAWSSGALASGSVPDEVEPYHLALWHGLEPALGISALTLLLGCLLFWKRDAVFAAQSRVPARIDAAKSYWAAMRAIDRTAARTTAATQRGSLPVYLGVILLVLVVAVGSALTLNRSWPQAPVLWDHPGQLAVAVLMAVGAIAAARATKRFEAVVLVGVTGYGMAALFAIQGAPDLAITQVLIETVTLVAFVLVLRRLPVRLGEKHESVHRGARAAIGIAVGLLMATVAMVALGSRVADPISLELPRMASEGGHGDNVVNVLLVDVRAWDTLGEVAVLIVAATGVASLIFLDRRTDNLPRLVDGPRRRGLFGALVQGSTEPRVRAGSDGPSMPLRNAIRDDEDSSRLPWLLAGRTLAPENRSILLEVVVRLLFHSLIVVSVYLLFAGHNLPGGGFAGGLVAGLALVARYLAGGRYELAIAAPIDAGRVLGLGLVFAVGTATVPLIFGADALTSTWFDDAVPFFGQVEFVTSTFFDVGVYLIVVGLVLDVLRSLGAEVDRQQEEENDSSGAQPTAAEESGSRV